MNWNGHATITPNGEGSFTTHIDDHWIALKGVHGGIVAALMVDAVEAVLRDAGSSPEPSLRAATFGYVSASDIGESTIDVNIIRQGRSMITSHATVTQNKVTTTVGRFHHSTTRTGHVFSDVEPPPTRPAGTVRLDPDTPNHFRNVETHLHPDTTLFGSAERAEWVAWSRPLDAVTFDTSWLTMLGDYFPPALFARTDQPSPAVTVEYSIQIHDDTTHWTLGPGKFLAARMHTFHSHDGFAVEDGWIHHPDGTLLATVRQTRLAG